MEVDKIPWQGEKPEGELGMQKKPGIPAKIPDTGSSCWTRQEVYGDSWCLFPSCLFSSAPEAAALRQHSQFWV